jgi:hypothetical protein
MKNWFVPPVVIPLALIIAVAVCAILKSYA